MPAAQAAFIPELEQALRHISIDQYAETVRRVADFFLADASRFNDEHVHLFDRVLGRLIVAIEAKALAELARRLAPVRNAPPRRHPAPRPQPRHRGCGAGPDALGAGSTTTTSIDIATTAEPGAPPGDLRPLRLERSRSPTCWSNAAIATWHATSRSITTRGSPRPGSTAGRTRCARRHPGREARAAVGRSAACAAQLWSSRRTRRCSSGCLPSSARRRRRHIRHLLAGVPPDVADAAADAEAQRAVRALQRAGKLDEAKLLDFANSRTHERRRSPRLRCCATCRSRWRAASWRDEQPDAALILCQAAGLSWPTACAIFKACNGGRASKLDKPFGDFDRLTTATAESHRRVLARLQRATAQAA